MFEITAIAWLWLWGHPHLGHIPETGHYGCESGGCRFLGLLADHVSAHRHLESPRQEKGKWVSLLTIS